MTHIGRLARIACITALASYTTQVGADYQVYFGDDPNEGCGAGSAPVSVEGVSVGCLDPESNPPVIPMTFPQAPPDTTGPILNPTPPPSGELTADSSIGVDYWGNDGQFCDANPIDISTGNKYQAQVDFVGSGRLPLRIERHYNSKGAAFAMNDGVFGPGWSSNLSAKVGAIDLAEPGDSPAIDRVIVVTETGTRIALESVNGATWTRESGQEVTFDIDDSNGHWYWYDRGTIRIYYPTGLLYIVGNEFGDTLTYEYDTNERLDKIVHSSGREIDISYDSQGRVSTIKDPGNLTYKYFYDTAGNLSRVEKPIGGSAYDKVYYHYGTGSAAHRLYVVRHKSNVNRQYAKFLYNSAGRAIQSSHGATENGDGVDITQIAFGTETSTTAQRTTTNPLGKDTNYTFEFIGGKLRATDVDGVASANCLASDTSYTYTSIGRYDEVTDAEGNKTKFTYDSYGNIKSIATGYGTSSVRTTTYDWDTGLGKVTKITAPLLETTIDYDAAGRMKSYTQKNTSPKGVPNQQRKWTISYSFYSSGILKTQTINGPRGDVTDITTLDYDSSGRLTKITNALGHITLFQNYDSYGRARKITYPAGLVQNFTFRADGKVSSVTDVVNGVSRVTQYDYNESGDLDLVTYPDGFDVRPALPLDRVKAIDRNRRS